ncbi:hypothetical protein AK830_g2035 [Neonectria ditissima]|uniref:Uncharacterized protein n=1 Tax=Neonectria ditissima TaxID=78410 RepID=A0A0P7BLE6_9HYPO|nr:hypothetical protein AK830_g2035 [Neonectria ditissima]
MAATSQHADYTPIARDLTSENKPDPLQKPARNAKYSCLQKLSTLTTVTIALAYLCVPCAVGFLCFLWSNPDGNEASKTWFDIVTSGWALKSITITTLILRTAISAQATICTSMLASIVLERHGVFLHAAAPLSALRFINNGPLSLLMALKHTYTQTRLWAWVTVLLFCTTVLLQFTSTVLVADIGIGTLADPARGHDTLVVMSYEKLNLTSMRGVGQNPYWVAAARDFPVFAERHEKVVESESTSDAVRDTGLTHRAFLPFVNASMRTSIRHFTGTATVLDSRVVCVRPKVHPGLSIGFTQDDGFSLNGTLTPEFAPAGLILPEEPGITQDLHNVSFNVGTDEDDDSSKVDMTWNTPIAYAHDAGEWNVIQKLMYFGPGLVSSLDPRYPSVLKKDNSDFTMSNPSNLAYGLTYFQKDDDIPLLTGRSYQVLNITASANTPSLINSSVPNGPKNFYFSADQVLNKLVLTPRDEWLVFTIPRIEGWHVSVSLCYDSFTSVDANVTISNDAEVPEPDLTAWNVTSKLFGTEGVRQQLGVLEKRGKNQAERAIMKLQTTPQKLRDQVKVWYDKSKSHGWSNISFPNQNFVRQDIKSMYSFGMFMCGGCGLQFQSSDTSRISYQYSNQLQVQIFQDVLRATGNSALAWQAYFMLIGRMAYYDMLAYFDVGDSAMISWFRSAQFPKTSWGLSVVIALLVVHLVLVTFISFVFLTRTEVSRVGDNAWQCLTQANYDGMSDEFRSLTLTDDDVVRELFRAEGLNGAVHLGALDEYPKRRIGLKRVG